MLKIAVLKSVFPLKLKSLNSSSSTVSIGSLLRIGLVANIFEWYELSVYGYMAQYLGQIFFPSANKTEAFLKALLAFSMSYLVKPLGSFYFGWLGDRYSRSVALKSSLLMMSFPTVLMGILPNWETGGLLASIALVGLRTIQGFASGGEGPISASYVFESAPLKYRGLLCSVVHVSAILGILAASLVTYSLSACFTEAEILAWGWRIPFLIGIPIILGIIQIRLAIVEPKGVRETVAVSPILGKRFLGAIPSEVLRVLSVMSFFLVAGHIVFASWFPIYLKEILGYPANIADTTHVLTLIARVVLCLGVGYLSRILGTKPLMMGSLVATFCFVVPLFVLLDRQSFAAALAMQLLFALCLSGIDGTFLEILGSLFPRAMRCRGMSWSYTALSTLLGSTTPFLCFYTMNTTGFVMFPAFYLAFWGITALLILYALSKAK